MKERVRWKETIVANVLRYFFSAIVIMIIMSLEGHSFIYEQGSMIQKIVGILLIPLALSFIFPVLAAGLYYMGKIAAHINPLFGWPIMAIGSLYGMLGDPLLYLIKLTGLINYKEIKIINIKPFIVIKQNAEE